MNANISSPAFRFSLIHRDEIALGWDRSVRGQVGDVGFLNPCQRLGHELRRWCDSADCPAQAGEIADMSDFALGGLIEELLRERGEWNLAKLAEIASWCRPN